MELSQSILVPVLINMFTVINNQSLINNLPFSIFLSLLATFLLQRTDRYKAMTLGLRSSASKKLI